MCIEIQNMQARYEVIFEGTNPSNGGGTGPTPVTSTVTITATAGTIQQTTPVSLMIFGLFFIFLVVFLGLFLSRQMKLGIATI